jgi:ubiquinone/menaquinone biosynthesis methyltransferase
MATKFLGPSFDLHAGGEDLMFPHHENEIAQSECASGVTFARHWMHVRFLLVEGKKMSKSEGNFYTLRDLLLKGYRASAIRFLLVSVPYRHQMNFTFDGLAESTNAIDRLRTFHQRMLHGLAPSQRHGIDNKGAHSQGADNKGTDNKGTDNKGTDNKGADNKRVDNKEGDRKEGDRKEVVILSEGAAVVEGPAVVFPAPILAIDFSHQMLSLGQKKFAPHNIVAIEADALHLPLADSSVDLVTSAFGFRNLANYEEGLAELRRILRPGGQLGILECNQPEGLTGALYNLYFKTVLPRLGGLISGKPAAYSYLPASVERFPRPLRMLELIKNAGFTNATWTSYTFGIAGLYHATKS